MKKIDDQLTNYESQNLWQTHVKNDDEQFIEILPKVKQLINVNFRKTELKRELMKIQGTMIEKGLI